MRLGGLGVLPIYVLFPCQHGDIYFSMSNVRGGAGCSHTFQEVTSVKRRKSVVCQ